MNIDIDTTFKVILILVAIGIITTISLALKSLQAARNLTFYRKRQDLVEHGWKMILFSLLLGGAGFLFYRFGEPIAYRYFPPSPTLTRTPTITTTPTITQTLENTLTPTITQTLAQTYTPMLPDVVQTEIKTPVGVEVNSIFSPVYFSTQTKDGWLINMTDTFTLPVTTLYAGFSYEDMVAGLRWTAVWLREGEIVCYETTVWENTTGGYYYSDFCNQKITPQMWVPGDWEVQIFVGQTWKTSGRFTILGDAPVVSGSSSPTVSPTTPLSTSTPEPVTNP
jgi:hypothetical protein